MTEKRTPRDGEQRDSDVRPSDSWIPASVIPDPEPQDGWVFRWVRTSILGQTDATHTSNVGSAITPNFEGLKTIQSLCLHQM